MSLQRLLWVSVKITHNNYHELQGLVDEHLEGIPYLAYHLIENRFTHSHSVLKSIEKVVPDFSKLPEIRLLISLGMSNRNAFNIVYGENQND